MSDMEVVSIQDPAQLPGGKLIIFTDEPKLTSAAQYVAKFGVEPKIAWYLNGLHFYTLPAGWENKVEVTFDEG